MLRCRTWPLGAINRCDVHSLRGRADIVGIRRPVLHPDKECRFSLSVCIVVKPPEDYRLALIWGESQVKDQAKRSLPDSAQDAIPADAVLLNDAYNWFFGQLESMPGLEDSIVDAADKASVEKSVRLQQAADPSANSEDARLWRIDTAAHLLLREGLAGGKIKAYIRNPDVGETLKIGHDGWWLDATPDTPIPPGPSLSSYVHPDHPYNPGPLTATLRGVRRIHFRAPKQPSTSSSLGIGNLKSHFRAGLRTSALCSSAAAPAS